MLRRAKQRAFSLVEMVVALTLSAVVGMMVVQALDSTALRASDNTLNARAQSAARETVDELTRALSAARLPIECQGVTEGALSAENCRNFTVATGEESSSVIYATDSCLIFYAYTREESKSWGANNSGTETSVDIFYPDLVVAKAANVDTMRTLMVQRFPLGESGETVRKDKTLAAAICSTDAPQGTIASVPSTRTTFIQRPLRSDDPIFEYLDRGGLSVPLPSGNLPIEDKDLKDIAIVEVNAIFNAAKNKTEEGARTFTVDLSVVLSAAGYDDTQGK